MTDEEQLIRALRAQLDQELGPVRATPGARARLQRNLAAAGPRGRGRILAAPIAVAAAVMVIIAAVAVPIALRGTSAPVEPGGKPQPAASTSAPSMSGPTMPSPVPARTDRSTPSAERATRTGSVAMPDRTTASAVRSTRTRATTVPTGP